MQRSLVSESIRQNFDEILSMIAQNTKYDMNFLLNLDIVRFFRHVRLIEKSFKNKQNG